MPDHHCEVAVQQQHSVRGDRSHIQHDWFCLGTAHAVGLQRWLDHGDSITGRFSIQQHPTVGCLIWTVAKDLNSGSSVSQMGCMPCCIAAGLLLASAQGIICPPTAMQHSILKRCRSGCNAIEYAQLSHVCMT